MSRSAKIMTVCFVAVLGLLALCGSAWAVEGMVSYWKLDEGSGTMAYDSVGDNHGTLFNGPVWDTGIVNNALYFERGKYVEIPDSDDLDFTTSLSIEAWVKADYPLPHLPHNDHQLVSKSSGCCDSYMLFYGWGNDLIFDIRTNESGFVGQGYNVPNHDSWHHFVATWDGSYMRLYVDGVKVLGKDGYYDRPATGTISPNNTPLRIAKSGRATGPYQANFYGWIDEVAVYNRALTGSEIWNSYVSVKAVYLLHSLAQKVIALNLQKGISNSLDAKLYAALQALDDLNENNDVAAINTLQAFINAVEAQRGKKISQEDADDLIAAAQEIIDLLVAE